MHAAGAEAAVRHGAVPAALHGVTLERVVAVLHHVWRRRGGADQDCAHARRPWRLCVPFTAGPAPLQHAPVPSGLCCGAVEPLAHCRGRRRQRQARATGRAEVQERRPKLPRAVTDQAMAQRARVCSSVWEQSWSPQAARAGHRRARAQPARPPHTPQGVGEGGVVRLHKGVWGGPPLPPEAARLVLTQGSGQVSREVP